MLFCKGALFRGKVGGKRGWRLELAIKGEVRAFSGR